MSSDILAEMQAELEHLRQRVADYERAVESHRPSDMVPLHEVVQHAPVVVFGFDREGRYLFSQGRGMARAGFQAADLIGVSIFDIYADQPHVLDQFRQALGGETSTVTLRVRDAVYHTWYAPTRDARGTIIGVHGVATDITPQIEAEHRLQEQMQFFQSLASLSPTGLFRTDAQGFCTFANARALEIAGLDGQPAAGLQWIAALHPDDRERVMALWQAAAETKQPFHAEYRFLRPDGSVRWVLGDVVPTLDEQGLVANFVGTITDISDQKQHERGLQATQSELKARVEERTREYSSANLQLREQKALLELVLDSMSDGVIVADVHHRVMLNNRAAARILAATTGTLTPNSWLDIERCLLIAPDQPFPLTDQPLFRALQGQRVEQAVLCLRTAIDHRFIWLEANAAPLLGSDGQPRGAILVFRDDTERRNTIRALQRSLERFDQVVDGAQIGLWDCEVVSDDPLALSNPIYFSRHFKQLLGYSEDEFPGLIGTWAQCLHPDDQARVFLALSAHLFEKVPYDIEYRCLTKQGAIRWFAARGQAKWDAAGRPVRMSGSFIDITERKRMENQFREQEELLQSILDSTPAVVYLKDLAGRYKFINKTYEKLFHVNLEQAQHWTDADMFDHEVKTTLQDNDRQVLLANQAIQFEEVVPNDGELRTYISVKFPLHDNAGNVNGIGGISTDITARKQAEERLRQEQDFLRRLIRAHERDRQLTAYEIHDGLVQYITAGVLQLESLAPVLRSLPSKEHLLYESSIEVLRQSINEARRVLSGLRPPILDEAGIIAALQYLVAEQAVAGKLDIRFHHHVKFTRLEPMLEGTIFRIVQESLTNIKKHSAATEADVTLVQLDDQLRVEIRDNGRGFDPLAVAPDRFGLQGMHKRASLMGGKLDIISTPGHGTCIELDMPVTTVDRVA